MKYGEHHARSTDALVWLLTHGEPVTHQELSAVLSCRMALLAAHRERCELAVRGADVRRAVFHDRQPGRDFSALARSGTAALAQLLDEYPTFVDHADRFTDVLQREDLAPHEVAWVQAAKHAVLATEALATNLTWKSQPGQAWQVVADIADAAQAIARLDQRLASPPEESAVSRRAALATPSAELALAARHVGYVSRCGALDGDVDGVTRRETRLGVVRVRTPEDLPQAAAATARLLERTNLSVAGLRRFAIMQAEISSLCGEQLSGHDSATLRDSFLERDSRFRALAGATARVSSISPAQDRPVLAQAQEIGRALVEAKRTGRHIPTYTLLDFDLEESRLAAVLARGVRSALDGGRYLVVDDASVALKWRRTAPGEDPAILSAAGNVGPSSDAVRLSPDLDFAALRLAALSQRGGAAPRSIPDSSPSRERLNALLASQPAGRRPLVPAHLPAPRV